MLTPRTQYARSGDVHLAYRVIGDGPRDIVLVRDVAGSTERASEVGDRSWRVARDHFEQTVRQTLLTHGGQFVDAAGDGVLATFDGPARAVRCASSLRGARDLVAGSGISFEERGEHTLKGVPDTWTLYAASG